MVAAGRLPIRPPEPQGCAEIPAAASAFLPGPGLVAATGCRIALHPLHQEASGNMTVYGFFRWLGALLSLSCSFIFPPEKTETLGRGVLSRSQHSGKDVSPVGRRSAVLVQESVGQCGEGSFNACRSQRVLQGFGSEACWKIENDDRTACVQFGGGAPCIARL